MAITICQYFESLMSALEREKSVDEGKLCAACLVFKTSGLIVELWVGNIQKISLFVTCVMCVHSSWNQYYLI